AVPSLAFLLLAMHGPSASDPTPALDPELASPPRVTRVLSMSATAVFAFDEPWRRSASAHRRSFSVAEITVATPNPLYWAFGSCVPDRSYRMCAMFDWWYWPRAGRKMATPDHA